MEKRNIVIFEALSTGMNYIHDIREAGHNPICIEMHDEEGWRDYYDWNYALNNEEPPEHIKASDSYEETLARIKEYDPICIIPASDEGIEWATRMAYDLGLPGNDPKNLKKMTDKQCMQDALKEIGARYLKSKVVSSFEEAEEFRSQIDTSKVVVKPSYGNSSLGVCICETDEEFKEALELNFKLGDILGKPLVQEYIGGDEGDVVYEYVVDSVCCKGHNRPVAALRNHKVMIGGENSIFDYSESIDETDEVFAELKEYNDKVLEAIGVEYGVTHIEYKIDEKGPALIEVNCRVAGTLQRYCALDKTWGEHESALSLESYINPEECIAKSDRPLSYIASFIMKYIIVYEDIYVTRSKVETAFTDLESFQYAISFGDDRPYPKMIDLSTAGGMVFLVNKNHDKVIEDVDEIRRIEKDEVEKIFDYKPPK